MTTYREEYEPASRGSGRTWRLLNDARDGDVLIVAHWRDVGHSRRLLQKMGRRSDAVRILPVEAAADRLRGWPRDIRIYIDHGVLDWIDRPETSRAYRELEEMAHARFGGVHIYPVSEPCDTGSARARPGEFISLGGGNGA